MNKFWVVFKRTFFKNVKSGGFYFMLLSPLLFLVIGYFIFNFINGEITQMNQGHIGVVGLAEEELDSLRSMTPEMTIDLLSEASGEAALQQDEISGYLVVSSDNNTVTYYTKNTSKEVSLKPIEQWFSMRARNELAGQIGISTEVTQRGKLLTFVIHPKWYAGAILKRQNSNQTGNGHSTKVVSYSFGTSSFAN